MMKVVTARQMRSIEARAEQAGVSSDTLMENAGLAVAHQALVLLENPADDVKNPAGVGIVILVGSGNNGGDGLVTARHLQQWGACVTVCLCGQRPDPDPKADSARHVGVDIVAVSADPDLSGLDQLFGACDLVIDAVLGTGRSRPIKGLLHDLLGRLKVARSSRDGPRLLALDVPTGLDCDTAEVDPACVAADLTVSLGYMKRGHLEFPGADFTGLLEVAEIGIPESLDTDVGVTMMTRDRARAFLPQRPRNSHKGTYGRVMVVAGSRNFPGAACLAAMAAARAGAGLVTIAIAESLVPAVASSAIEPTFLPLPESEPGIPAPDAADIVLDALGNYDTLLIGCGLGQAPRTRSMVSGILFSNRNLPETIVDADGLNTLAQVECREGNWHKCWRGHGILTPHVGEMSRLTGVSTNAVSARRLDMALEHAVRWNKTVILKGAHSVVAHPDGSAILSAYANPGLATAGSGDVLAGIITGLVAQGVSPALSAEVGVYIHGSAGERVCNKIGNTGMIASDLLAVIPQVIHDLREMEDERLGGLSARSRRDAGR